MTLKVCMLERVFFYIFDIVFFFVKSASLHMKNRYEKLQKLLLILVVCFGPPLYHSILQNWIAQLGQKVHALP